RTKRYCIGDRNGQYPALVRPRGWPCRDGPEGNATAAPSHGGCDDLWVRSALPITLASAGLRGGLPPTRRRLVVIPPGAMRSGPCVTLARRGPRTRRTRPARA